MCMTTLSKSSTIVQDFLTLSGFVRTHYLKQHVSEISPSAVTLGGTESWHRYDIRYDSLVYVEVLVEETNESVSSSEVFQRLQGLNQCNLIAYLQFPAEPTQILKKPLPPDASHQSGLGSIPRLSAICGLSLLVLYSAPRGFLRVLRFPLSSKTNIWLGLC